MNKTQLIIFTRYPIAGQAKTRLIPALGAEGAARLQREMTEYAVQQARASGAAVEVQFTEGSPDLMRNWLGPDLSYTEQSTGDLGERMAHAFESHFNTGAERVVLIGADCPENRTENIAAAFRALETHDVAIGPARDGGYYLIGLTRPQPQLFHGINWGSDQVLKQTLSAAQALSVHALPEWSDVDEASDIPPLISVIIPARNEAAHLAHTLQRAHTGFNVETLVVDGGSCDETIAVAQTHGASVYSSNKGRAAQQNLGAEKAKGALLLFLHADTELPENWDTLVRHALQQSSVSAGAFSFQIKDNFRGRKTIELLTNWRSRTLEQPYGDQSLFLTKPIFDQLGGFPDMPIMEDYEIVLRLKKVGKIITLPQSIRTSGRRWIQHGAWKVTGVNKLMIWGYRFGISADRLAQFYRKQ